MSNREMLDISIRKHTQKTRHVPSYKQAIVIQYINPDLISYGVQLNTSMCTTYLWKFNSVMLDLDFFAMCCANTTFLLLRFTDSSYHFVSSNSQWKKNIIKQIDIGKHSVISRINALLNRVKPKDGILHVFNGIICNVSTYTVTVRIELE